jgi:two-component system alkaline phosphatase synthesis response regulator PhoP
MKKILIIEDDKEISDLLEIHLTDIDCEITKEYDGIIGLNNVKYNNYDLIVLDVMLPGMNGL